MDSSPFVPPPGGLVTPAPANGNLALAIAAGFVAALVGGILWSALVAATNIKIGYAAIGVGFLVGWSMRSAGKGHDKVYGVAGAILALLGCVFGDVLTDCVFVARAQSVGLFDVIARLTPSLAAKFLQSGFKPLDALFYIIAMMAGYRNAFIKS